MPQPDGLLYSKEHEWLRLDGEIATVGITEYAQNSLGDIVYVDFPRVGAALVQFGEAGAIESVKAVSELFTPIGGQVAEINKALEDDPALVNRDPYGEGWLFKIKTSDVTERNNLMSAQAYADLVRDQ